MSSRKVTFWNSLVSRFAIFFTALNIIAILIVGYLVYNQAASVITAHSQERLRYTSNLALKSFNSLLTEVANDIAVTTNNPAIGGYFSNPSNPSSNDLKALFATVLENKPNYFQIRLLDATNNGKEMIRYDKVEGKAVQIPDDQLQFKGDRLYFQEALKIAKGSYYYSNINLNEEFGKVSLPQTPTLRALGQVYDDQDSLRALLVINVDLSAFYGELRQIMGLDYQLFLVNDLGDYLFAKNMDICFGHQLGSGYTFPGDFNQSIENLVADQNIGFIQDESDNNFLFHREVINYSPGQQIYLINLQPDNLIFRSAHLVRNDSFKLVVLVCLISSFIALLFARVFSRNINQITEAVSSYEEESLDHMPKLPQNRKDEIGVLARTLVRMRHRIDRQFEELKEALSREQQAIKEKNQFLQNMSHELRTPLNAILGLTKLLNKNNPTKDQQPIIESLERSALNLSGLMHDVLDHQKLLEGAVQLNLQAGNFHSLLRDIHASYRYEAVTKGLNFEMNIKDTLQTTSYLTDPLRFTQIITNLVVNAIKYTESGSVQLDADILETEPRKLKVAVSDSGIGISVENLQKIKERFYQEPSNESGSEEGYGLGLSIVKQLVDLFDGTLEVSSKKGQGSTFTVLLPLTPIEVPGKEANSTAIESRLPQLKGPYTLLHLDDDPSTLLMVSHILEMSQISLVSVTTLPEAVSLLKNRRFDLMVSDLMLNNSVIDQELIEIVKSSPIPVILLSAFEPSRMKAISAYYLQKPFEQADLKNLAVILLGQQEYDYPYLENIYSQYDYQPEKINNFLSILQQEFDSYVTRFEKVFETRDHKEWEAILHKLTTHIKSLKLEKLDTSIPESPAELHEVSHRTIINGLLYCLCVFRYESTRWHHARI